MYLRNLCRKSRFLITALLILCVCAAPAAAASSTTLAPGTKYATTMYIIETGKPGPVVLLTGGIHGNEPAGYEAAAQLKNLKITKGTLIVIPRVNQAAIQVEKRAAADGNLNRLFPTTATAKVEHVLVREIMAVIDKYQVTWVLDLHEGVNYSKKSDSVGQSVIYYPQDDTYTIARKIVNMQNKTITTATKQFSLLKNPVKGSLARSAAVLKGAHSMILETCTKDALNTRINYHVKSVKLVLSELGML
jgi:predicted deacylase